MDLKVQQARIIARLEYYKEVIPARLKAYGDFKKKTIIPRLHEALRRIDEGTYGECLCCGETIEEARLHAIPGALRCVPCQRKNEKT